MFLFTTTLIFAFALLETLNGCDLIKNKKFLQLVCSLDNFDIPKIDYFDRFETIEITVEAEGFARFNLSDIPNLPEDKSVEVTIRNGQSLVNIFPAGLPNHSVRSLSLSGLALERISSSIVGQFPNLDVLSVTKNRALNLEIDPEIGKTLSELYLSSNKLTKLPRLYFGDITSDRLNILDLSDNFISTIDERYFSEMFILKPRDINIDLSGNILSCDENISWFQEDLNSYNFAVVKMTGIDCYSPEKSRGQDIMKAKKFVRAEAPIAEKRIQELKVLDNHAIFPCPLNNTPTPVPFRKWKIDDLEIVSFEDRIIFPDPSPLSVRLLVLQATIDERGCLILHILNKTDLNITRDSKCSCEIYNNAGSTVIEYKFPAEANFENTSAPFSVGLEEGTIVGIVVCAVMGVVLVSGVIVLLLCACSSRRERRNRRFRTDSYVPRTPVHDNTLNDINRPHGPFVRLTFAEFSDPAALRLSALHKSVRTDSVRGGRSSRLPSTRSISESEHHSSSS